MAIRAFLYDATGTDQEVPLTAQRVKELHARQLLWVDVADFEEIELRRLMDPLSLQRESIYTLLQLGRRPRLDHYPDYSQFNIQTIQQTHGKYELVEVDFILAANLIVTVHRKPVGFLDSFDQRVKGDSDLGELDAPAFLAGLLDWHVTSYFRLLEELELEVDKIDAHALRPRYSQDLLAELAKVRQRVSFVRRTLTPHREVYAAMARPDFQVIANSSSSPHFRNLANRLDRAIEAMENARELLVGSFDIFTTQTTLRTNEVIKVLTIVSFVWFPASVIVGIAALLLKTPVNPATSPGFWITMGVILSIALSTVALARWKHWI
ncbi:MAG: magnesium transporter CorA [Chthonomonadaceae bacterium]|nr:magnesium transporter CorA [Chthonomonadaceae bacterium]